MNPTRQIIIADNYLQRSEEMARLARSLQSVHSLDIHMLECLSDVQRELVSVQACVKVNNLIDTHSDIILVTNCTIGVKHELFSRIRSLEAQTQKSVRKVLLTCKKGWEIRSGFAERGVSLEGIEHVIWNPLHSSLHHRRMASIFQGNPPEKNPI